MADSSVVICGNLTRDPELRFMPNGGAVVGLSVAVNRRKFNKGTNEWDEEVSFIDVSVFAESAEHVANSLVRGSRIIAAGRLEQQRWEQDGQNRSKIVLIADEIGPSLRFATCVLTKTERVTAEKAEQLVNNAF